MKNSKVEGPPRGKAIGLLALRYMITQWICSKNDKLLTNYTSSIENNQQANPLMTTIEPNSYNSTTFSWQLNHASSYNSTTFDHDDDRSISISNYISCMYDSDDHNYGDGDLFMKETDGV